MENFLHIVIGGNIGCGKTTLAKKLCSELDAIFVQEPHDAKVLAANYKDPTRNAFLTEIYFLRARLQAWQYFIRNRSRHVVEDRSVFEDGVFAKTRLERGEMTPLEYEQYIDLLELHISMVERPTVYVYLKCSPEKCMERLAKRMAETKKAVAETGAKSGPDTDPLITMDFVRDLAKSYEEWATRGSRMATLWMEVDVEEDSDYSELCSSIAKTIVKNSRLFMCPCHVNWQKFI
ncbi:MAG: hypothetical protein EHM41_00990 [Chloroflexi bacterium]|nr:MAG: hypothetical protein EHM41_00990 [Chloroflexota bacterium]